MKSILRNYKLFFYSFVSSLNYALSHIRFNKEGLNAVPSVLLQSFLFYIIINNKINKKDQGIAKTEFLVILPRTKNVIYKPRTNFNCFIFCPRDLTLKQG